MERYLATRSSTAAWRYCCAERGRGPVAQLDSEQHWPSTLAKLPARLPAAAAYAAELDAEANALVRARPSHTTQRTS